MSDNVLESGRKEGENLAAGARGGAVTFILKISNTALSFINQILLARILGAEGLGQVVIVISLARILTQISKFGMEEAMMRFLPVYIDQKDVARIKGAVYFALTLCLFLSVFFAILLYIFSEYIAVSFYKAEKLQNLFYLIAFAIPAWAVKDVIGGILRGHKDAFRAFFPESLVSPFFRLVIFIVLFKIQGVSPVYAVIAVVIGEVFSMFVSIKFLLGKISLFDGHKTKYAKKQIIDVAYTVIFTSMGMLVFTHMDGLILGKFRPLEFVGYYNTGARAAFLVYFPMMAFASIIPSIISSIYASGDLKELRSVVRESTRWILSMAVPIILILLLEGKFLLETVYGPEYAAGYVVLVILTIGQLIKSGAGLIGVILQMTGNHKVYMKVNIVWGIINIILDIILAPKFGMVGIALATAFCLSMIDIICIFIIHRKLSIITLAKGVMFDIVFLVIVSIIFYLMSYINVYMGQHILLLVSLTVYLWKTIANNDVPWRLLIPKYKET